MNEVISLDLETSGLRVNDGATILSIGLYHPATGAEFYREVKHEFLFVEPSAMRVNKLDVGQLDYPNRVSMSDLDMLTSDWLWAVTGVRSLHELIPIGWNVASFDMMFVKKFLPYTATLFSYRSIDLNAVLLFEDVVTGSPLLTSKRAYQESVINTNPHNALADAVAAGEVFKKLIAARTANEGIK